MSACPSCLVCELIYANFPTDISPIPILRKSHIQKVSRATRSQSVSFCLEVAIPDGRLAETFDLPDGKVVADLIHARLSIPVEEVLEETEMMAVQDGEIVALTDEDDPIVMDAVEEAELGNRDVEWQD